MGIIEKAASRLVQPNREPIVASEAARTVRPINEFASAPDLVLAHDMPSVTDAGLDDSAAAIQSKPVSKQVELNLAKLSEQGIITPDTARSKTAEEFRAIKRTLLDRINIQGGPSGRRSNLIMVTSCFAGEGKTFCAINLAMSIAMELDHTVLLVDADVARPATLTTLELPPSAGLMDVLLERDVHVPDVMLRTNVSTLSLLPAGVSHRNSTELLASKNMSDLLDEIASRYSDRVVIFDSPPLLLTSEARVLASQMGQIVVVVEAETTTQKALKNALGQIQACPNVNLVYNKAKGFGGGNKYGYYGYYK